VIYAHFIATYSTHEQSQSLFIGRLMHLIL